MLPTHNLPYEKIGKNDPVCIADEVPCDIPDTWEWTRLSVANDMYTGNSINENEKKAKYMGLREGRFYIGTKDVSFSHDIDYDNGVRIPYDNDKFRIAPQNSILLCIEGGSAGRKIAFTNQDVCFGNKLCCFVSYGIDPLYLYYYLQCPLFQTAFKDNTSGIIGGVSVNVLKDMLLPVPPYKEQKRIVAEIEKIIPHIEKYDAKETVLRDLLERFPKQLKQSILQQAVMGKLVPQDSNDEPASILLDRIRAEKEALIKAGKLKKDKHESIIFKRDNSHYEKIDNTEICIDEEIPFEIPESWEWCRLGNIVSFIGGYAYKSTDFVEESDYQVLRLGNVKNDLLKLEQKPVFIPEQLAISTNSFICKDYDILLTMTGTRGKRDYFYTVMVRGKSNLYINQRVGCLRSYLPETAEWLIWALKSECVLSQVFEYETGTANQGNLGAENILKTLIPIPPRNEQKRICDAISRAFSEIAAL